MKLLLKVGLASAILATSVSAQTLPDQSVPTVPTTDAANTPTPGNPATAGTTPRRAGPRVKRKSGFFGLPLLALAAAGAGAGAAAASSGGDTAVSPGGS